MKYTSTILGLMSGTSLDGLDMALCRFSYPDTILPISFELLAAETVPYTDEWRNRLATLHEATAKEYALADVQLGHYFGRQVSRFLSDQSVEVTAIASHGHTIFHQPHHQLTTQIGCGDAIAAECGLPVVFNFRRLDVARGGQGAPLVPIGDEVLFGSYDACLNLGGFSNISYGRGVNRKAFDISPCNMVLNMLAQTMGAEYDKDGAMAERGVVINDLMFRLNALPYYSAKPPKSLGKEWFEREMKPIVESYMGDGRSETLCSVMRTLVEHIAQQVAMAAAQHHISSILVTGGGAHNRFLLQRIKALSIGCRVEVPDKKVVDYKEAIVFALLGLLRLHHRNNCMASATGALCDSCGGDVAGLPYGVSLT